MTNTLQPTSDDTWRFPANYLQEEIAPGAETADTFGVQTEVDAREIEAANALYWNNINNEPVEPAHITDARADVHHAIDLGTPETRTAATPESNAQFITAAVHQARALTTQYILPMRNNANVQLNAEANNPERVA